MKLRIGRTLPPAAAPLQLSDIVSGVAALFKGANARNKFEEELKGFYQVGYCLTVSSGKAALVLILKALHDLLPDRNEVLIPAYTCYSVPSAIIRAGLKVRLCDLAHGSLDFDFDCLGEHLDNPRLLCVIPTHLYGMPADVKRVKELIGRRSIWVVEDAAQAMGGEWRGMKMGTQGDVSLFSMGRGKAFSTVEGGVIITGNEDIGQALRRRLASVPDYGPLDCFKLLLNAVALSILINPRIYWLPKSLPFLKLGETHFDTSFVIRRMSSFQAGIAKKWRKKIAYLREVRRENVERIVGYGIIPFGASNGMMPDLIRFPLLCADADTKREILEQSEKQGLGIADGYPDSIDGILDLEFFTNGKGVPMAKFIAERIVSLPVHPFVNNDDIQRIVRIVNRTFLIHNVREETPKKSRRQDS